MLRSKRTRRLPAITHPAMTIDAVHESVTQLKEAVELLQGQSGGAEHCAVTWGDLVLLGLIKEDQIPRDVGKDRLRG